MSTKTTEAPALGAAEERRDTLAYVWGVLGALILTLIPFGLVAWGGMDRSDILVVIAVFAIIQALIHFRCFLHVGLRQNREDLLLLIFSGFLLAFLIVGTLWVIANLATRMMEMLPGMGM